MITIRVGEAVRSLDDIRNIDESWINQQINRRRADNQPVCVQISIKDDPINMSLISAGCSGGGGGTRRPSSQEEQIFDLWEKAGMHKDDFHGVNLVAFFKQLRGIM